ncbi:ATP-binding protein [Ruminococcus callidus]|jgi:two-component system phosphate regulon sensor histidine kinase PhoR|uniref:sensor histidine kinase n=1 Tax=Ruminococcus callidus TaxID=40519 RepID=UPI000EEEE65A|nr:ATP-binding protein [Ruminococcus callidus]HCD39779.1 histidine kinase [Ruminococcus sp.]HCY34822.1 histidine kinase [Ruminococcus sp.]
MTRKIFQSIIAVVISVLLLSLALITGVLYNHFETTMLDQLRTTAQFAEQGVEQEGMAYFDSLHAQNCRVTWIAADGTVKYDNRSNPKTMENHADRQEVREAMENDSGTSVRRSSTLSEHTMYYAKRLSDGTVLRLSMSQRSVLFLMGGMLSPLVFIFLAACLLAGVLSYRVSKKIVKPLSEIDLKHPEQVETYDELSPFLQRIAAQNREIDARMAEIRKQQQEFSMITENMSEGLFVVDRNYQILSYNKSAMQIFGMDPRQEHENLLAVNRSEGFRNAVDSALKGRHTQENLELNGRVYQIIANAVCQPDFAEDMVGAVILVLDVTEKEAQEQYRREFTANVSHELKTPLTSISGIAEIIRNGIVKPEDIPHFAGKIYDESQRLITLIGDIIKLSRLDENQVPMERETVDMLEMARDVVQQLSSVARKSGVTLVANGSHGQVQGVRQVLGEMVYNLCENAVKYNRAGGRVWVDVQQVADHVVLRVKDTGIGIPAAEQGRIFERFYRVDKSHSKAVGGTGLGLSIVKHGAALHHATISVSSEPEQGTEITLTFPAA